MSALPAQPPQARGAALPLLPLPCSLLLTCKADWGQFFNTRRETILRLQAARILKQVRVNIAFMTVRVIKRNRVHFLEAFYLLDVSGADRICGGGR